MLPIALKFYDNLSPLDTCIATVEKSITEIQSIANQLSTVSNEVHHFSKQHQEVTNQISNLTDRINQLVSHNNQIQNQIEDINVAVRKKPDAESAQQSILDAPSQPTTSTTNSAYDIVEEMRDREHGRWNLVVYNFSEGSNLKADIDAFKALSNTVFHRINLTLQFQKQFI